MSVMRPLSALLVLATLSGCAPLRDFGRACEDQFEIARQDNLLVRTWKATFGLVRASVVVACGIANGWLPWDALREMDRPVDPLPPGGPDYEWPPPPSRLEVEKAEPEPAPAHEGGRGEAATGCR